MKRWKERTIYQQLAIILSISLCCLLLFYFLTIALSTDTLKGIIFLIIFVLILFYCIIRGLIIDAERSSDQKSSGKSALQPSGSQISKERKLTSKEILVIGICSALAIPSIIVCAHYETIRIFFTWLILIFFALAICILIPVGAINLFRERCSLKIVTIGLPIPRVIWNIIKSVSFWGCFLVGSIWFIGFVSIFFAAGLNTIGRPMVSSSIRVPLEEPGGIAVDSQGRIYYKVHLYNRVQVYDKNGHFLRSWFVPGKGTHAPTQMIIDEDDYLHVEAGRYDTKRTRELDKKVYYVFSINGDLIKKHSEKYSYTKIPDVFKRKDADGNTYEVKGRWFPKVVKITPSGKEAVLISDPFYLKFLAPFPSFIGAMLLCVSYYLNKMWNKRAEAMVECARKRCHNTNQMETF